MESEGPFLLLGTLYSFSSVHPPERRIRREKKNKVGVRAYISHFVKHEFMGSIGMYDCTEQQTILKPGHSGKNRGDCMCKMGGDIRSGVDSLCFRDAVMGADPTEGDQKELIAFNFAYEEY